MNRFLMTTEAERAAYFVNMSTSFAIYCCLNSHRSNKDHEISVTVSISGGDPDEIYKKQIDPKLKWNEVKNLFQNFVFTLQKRLDEGGSKTISLEQVFYVANEMDK